jgi:photosystem II CP47 chlorophyll apoprotein
LAGQPSPVSYEWGPSAFDAFNPKGLASHHLAAGLLGVLGGAFHLTCRPSLALYTLLRIGNLETVLASSVVSVAWASIIASAGMWYGSASNPIECFGPTRYMWDLGYHLQAIETRIQQEVGSSDSTQTQSAWEVIPDRLAFYDYIGNNPAKGGLFRTGPMVRGDGLIIGWLGHPSFRLSDSTPVYPRRMPSFFETFPVLFVDAGGVVRADQPFRRAEAKYAIEGVGLNVMMLGGALSGVKLTSPSTVAAVARTAQFGELLDFDRASVEADGVLRSSVRGWYAFAHLCFGLLFLFGHWWHASRTLYRDLLSGLEGDASTLVEFGAFRKVGDATTTRAS